MSETGPSINSAKGTVVLFAVSSASNTAQSEIKLKLKLKLTRFSCVSLSSLGLLDAE